MFRCVKVDGECNRECPKPALLFLLKRLGQGVIGKEAFDLWRENGLWRCTGQKDYAVPSVAYSQTLSLPLELAPLTPSCPRVLSCWGAKGAVVVSDNRAPADQSEDVIGELMELASGQWVHGDLTRMITTGTFISNTGSFGLGERILNSFSCNTWILDLSAWVFVFVPKRIVYYANIFCLYYTISLF